MPEVANQLNLENGSNLSLFLALQIIVFLLCFQAGGLMPVAPPISMGCSIQLDKTMESSMVSSGTTSKAPATPCVPPP